VIDRICQLWVEESGQDVAEYAVMLAVILVIVVGTVRLIGGNANNVFRRSLARFRTSCCNQPQSPDWRFDLPACSPVFVPVTWFQCVAASILVPALKL